MNIFITQLTENPRYFFLVTLAVIPSICLHEYFHAQVALWCGDDTAARNGHLTLNPLKQMGWISLIMFFFIGIAWGQVPVDPRRLTRKQDALVSFAGPFMNLVLAAGAWIACIFLPRFVEAGVVPELLFLYIFVLGMYNIVLFVINMLPIPGLDGWNVLNLFFNFRSVKSEFVKGSMLFLMLGVLVLFDYIFSAAEWVMCFAMSLGV